MTRKRKKSYIPLDAGKNGAFWVTPKEYRRLKQKSKKREKRMK